MMAPLWDTSWHRRVTPLKVTETMPYRDVLEDRIRNAPQYIMAFQQENPAPGAPTVMVRSRFACVGCHQR
jgi:hypothetical protein